MSSVMQKEDEETSCILITEEYIEPLLSIFDRENIED